MSAHLTALTDRRHRCGPDRNDSGGHVAESGATLVEFATPEETIAAVRNGEADAVLADKDFLVARSSRNRAVSWSS